MTCIFQVFFPCMKNLTGLSHYSLIIFFSSELSTWEPLWPHWILEITEKIWLRQTRHCSGTQEVQELLLLHYMICLSSLTAVIQLFKLKYSLRASCFSCLSEIFTFLRSVYKNCPSFHKEHVLMEYKRRGIHLEISFFNELHLFRKLALEIAQVHK